MKKIKTIMLVIASMFLATAVFAQYVQPTTIDIGGKSYQIIYEAGISEQSQQANAFLQNEKGQQGFVQFTFSPSQTIGTVHMGNKGYTLEIKGNATKLTPLDLPAQNPHTDHISPRLDPPLTKSRVRTIKQFSIGANSKATIDVMVLYTAAAKNFAGGVAGITDKINKAVAEANKAFVDSGIFVILNLVYSGEVAYTESSSMASDLITMSTPGSTIGETVASLRNQYGADMVSLFVNSADIYAGIGYLIKGSSTDAFTVIQTKYGVGYYTYVHELGHNFGCGHDRDTVAKAPGSDGAFTYSYGYRFKAYNTLLRTVMAYDPGSRIGFFSTPVKTLGGIAVGTATEDNARTINERAALVAGYKTAPTITLNLTLTKNGTGTLLVNGATASTSTITIPSGKTVSLEAQGTGFLGWTGSQSTTNKTLQFILNTNATIVANFQDGSIPLSPQITLQPVSQNIPVGKATQLAADGYGIPAPTFTWKRNGQVIGTGKTYSIANASSGNAGIYVCTIVNSAGSVQSAEATVAVGTSPQIIQQPVTQIAQVDGNAMFSIRLDTDAIVSYQWYFNGTPLPFATNRTHALFNISKANMGKFSVVATTPDYTVKSADAELLLSTPPAITQQPARNEITKGQNANFIVKATGLAPISYQWQFNEVDINGATTSSFTIPNAQLSNAGSYRVRIFNPQGVTSSTNATLVVYDILNITQQPTNTIAIKGTTPILYVTATGTEPVTYQWKFNGVSLQDQVYKSCRIKNVQLTNAGVYTVEIKNPTGTLSSDQVVLAVLDPPVISQQIINTAVNEGSTATFAVSATGRQPMSCKWFKDASLIAGATGPTLQIAAVTTDNTGYYSVEVSNQDGKVTSGTAQLSLNYKPTIAAQPKDTTVTKGASTGFSVTVGGATPISYQWYFNGTPIGINANYYTISSAQASMEGNYYVIAKNNVGQVTSATVKLTVSDPPKITGTASVMYVDEGANLDIAPTITGKTPMTYVWKHDNMVVATATTAKLTIANAKDTDKGTYIVTASNTDGNTTCPPINVALNKAPTILQQPTSVQTAIGTSATFNIAASGAEPLTYLWTLNGNSLGIGTNILNIAQTALTNEGTYQVTVTNRLGKVSSTNATLKLAYPPTITTDIASKTAIESTSTAFTVTAIGRPPMTYTWSKNGTVIPGATTATLSFASVKSTDTADYSVAVKNDDGTITSQVARLVVVTTPAFTVHPASTTVNRTAKVTLTSYASSTVAPAYQWYFNGNPLPQATNTTLTFAADTANTGAYQMYAVNAAGTIKSSTATLTVKDPPVFTVQPSGNDLYIGDTLTMSVETTGKSPITYQWKKDGAALAGQTQKTLSVSITSNSQGGAYGVDAINTDGTTASVNIRINIIKQPPVITKLPAALSLAASESLTIPLTVTGLTPMTYRWYHDGTVIANATTDTLTLSDATAKTAGKYYALVSNTDGSTTSTTVTVTVTAKPPIITVQPSSTIVGINKDATFTVQCQNPAGLSYQWLKNQQIIDGASNELLTIANAQDADVANYSVNISNKYGDVASAEASLKIATIPVITQQPTDIVNIRGTSVNSTVIASGTGSKYYQWNREGKDITGATNSTLAFKSLADTDTGNYFVTVASDSGSVTSRTFTVTIKDPPVITKNPAALTIIAGNTAAFSVEASGKKPQTYQWNNQGTTIFGATDARLSLANVKTSDAGAYSVTISNEFGSVTSTSAQLTVQTAPAITTQPLTQTGSLGSSVNLSTTATGTQPIAYQWFFNDKPVANGTSATLNIAGLTASNEGSYYVQLSNIVGIAKSTIAVLTVSQPPVITLQPVGGTNNLNSTKIFTVSATGRTPLTYQWQKMQVNIANATNSQLIISSITSSDVARYRAIVSNKDGSTASTEVTLALPPMIPAGIVVQPASVVTTLTSNVTLWVAATGSDPLAYQWKLNGTNLIDQTQTNLVITSVSSTNLGDYTVTIDNTYGHIESDKANVRLSDPPVITAQPTGSTIAAFGDNVTLSITAKGGTPLAYQWQKKQVNIASATNSQLTIANVAIGDITSYRAIVSNQDGTVTSADATLTLPPYLMIPPGITKQPGNIVTTVGSSTRLSVMVSGTEPLSYQWYLNGATLAGQTSTNLDIASVSTANLGDYYVTANNRYGSVQSATANLRFSNPPVITVQPAGATVAFGDSKELSVSATGRNPLSYQWYKSGIAMPGITSSRLTLNNISSSDITSYKVIVSNTDGSATSSTATITMDPARTIPAGIALQPSSTNALPNTSVTLFVVASGSSPLTYQWSLNGTNIAGQTSSNIVIAVTDTNLGNYAVSIDNPYGHIDSAAATLKYANPPVITQQPVTTTVVYGDTATLSVTATGGAPLKYQWQKMQSNIAGATSAQLTVANININDIASYKVVVSNNDGTATSAYAALKLPSNLTIPPGIIVQPTNIVTTTGSSVTLAVTPSGSEPFSYQWFQNGTPLTGKNSNSLVISSVATGNLGNYYVIVSNNFGSLDSATATIRLSNPPVITAQPASAPVAFGDTRDLSVAATGLSPLAYQWYKGGIKIAGATSSRLTLNNISSSDITSYKAVVSNADGSATSQNATLTLDPARTIPAGIAMQPSSTNALQGTSVTLFVVPSGSSPLSYQWSFNGTNIAGQTQSNLVFTVTTTNIGNYTINVSNPYGQIDSEPATVKLAQPPVITQQPVASTVAAFGDTVTLTTTVTGAAPIKYQWQKMQADITGATNATLTLANITIGDIATYRVIVSNTDGSVTSQNATLTLPAYLMVPPGIVVQPANVVTTYGTTAAFSVTASGTEPLAYQWYLNGTAISGQTSSKLSISSVAAANLGNYSVTINNRYGNVQSTSANLRQSNPPVITAQPAGATVAFGDTRELSVTATGLSPLLYQWYKAGAAMPGATSSRLTLANISSSDITGYKVIVSNTDGSATSSTATISLSPDQMVPAGIVVQPFSTNALSGASITLFVVPSGVKPLTYQWSFNGTNITGQTQSNLVITVSDTTIGSYMVSITNAYGHIDSDKAVIGFAATPSFTTTASDLNVIQGSTVTIEVGSTNATGFNWYQNGVLIGQTATPKFNLANAASGIYTVQATNAWGTQNRNFRITAHSAPAIASQPANVSSVRSASVTFAVTATGETLSYQWQKDGANLTGANGTTLNLANLATSQAGNYSVKITSPYGNIASTTAMLIVKDPPVITLQPQSGTYNQGQTATLTVAATGKTPMTYKWTKNGQSLVNNSAAVTLPNIQNSDAGTYSVTIVNDDGSAVSATATVTLKLAPYVTDATQTLSPLKGSNTSIKANASGEPTLSYQWQFNGADINGATTSTLALSNIQTNQAGTYTVKISNAIGSITPSIAVVTVKDPPVITTQPVAITVSTGSPAVFTVAASGRAPFSYQWKLNGTDIPGAYYSSYTNANAQTAGTYSVVVSNTDGSTTSANAALSINQAPTFTTQPYSRKAPLSGSTTFAVTVAGNGPFTYQWAKNNNNILNATSSTLVINSIKSTDAGSYTVKVTSPYGSATSTGATLTVQFPPVITIQPVSKIIGQGTDSFLDISAEGLDPMTYTWYKNGSIINNTASRVLSIVNAQLADSGSYTVIVSNADGQATSTAATVSIRPLPVIITQPQTQIITLSNSVTFTVEASSPNETVLYQWVKNGYSIPGSTNSSLTITNVQTTDAGTYAVYVGNSVGYIASEPALLIVLPIQPMKIAKDQILGQVLQMAPMPNGQMGFLYYGAIGKTYDIQASSDTFTWETLAEVVPTQNINQFIDTHAAEFEVRFYRIALKIR